MDKKKNLTLRELQNSDIQTIKMVYEHNREYFIGYFIKSYGMERDSCNELFQESVAILFYNLKNKKVNNFDQNPLNYLIGIGSNLMKKQFSHKQRYKFYSLDEDMQIPENETAQDEKQWYEKVIEITKNELNKLEEPCHSLLKKFYYEQFNLDELLNETGYKNKDTLKSQKARCLKYLKEKVLQKEKTLNFKD